jgi:hypothetical protein
MQMSGQRAIEDHWRQDQALFVDGITMRSGRVILLNAYKVEAEGRVTCAAAPLADTTAASVLAYTPDAWVNITATESRELQGGRRLLAGEGAMGNEGFVALELDHQLEWILFCTVSNPFSDLGITEHCARAVDGYGGIWRIPLAAPESFTIERPM